MRSHVQTVRWVWLGMLVAEAIIVLHSFTFSNDLVNMCQTAARISGRLSLVIFSTLFMLYRSDNRAHGVIALFSVFAVAHGIHLVELITYQFVKGSEEQLLTPRVGGGVAAYLFIFLTPFMHRLERQNKIVDVRSLITFEYVYLYFIWTVFLFTYLPRVFGTPAVGGRYYEFIIGLVITISIIVIRIVGAIWRKFSRPLSN